MANLFPPRDEQLTTGLGNFITAASASCAAVESAMTLDLAQPVPLTNTAQTVGDAENAANAEGFGACDLSGSVLTMRAPDGVTPVHSFTWDDPDNPASRT
jgi:hypothetical protein